MPHYIYLHVDSQAAFQMDMLWITLRNGVLRNKISDLESLQYPPHITLSCSFEMESTKHLEDRLRDILSVPFRTKPSKIWMSVGENIHSVNLEWLEMSIRVRQLAKEFPSIPWVFDKYHLTLAHKGTPTTMRDVVTVLPKFDSKLWTSFRVTLWDYKILKSSRSWERRKWNQKFVVLLK